MAKLKCWKKVISSKSRDLYQFKGKKIMPFVELNKFSDNKTASFSTYYGNYLFPHSPPKNNFYGERERAINKAKSYMKKHDKC